jgi:hypothetical protein
MNGAFLARKILDDFQLGFTIIFLLDIIIRLFVAPSFSKFFKNILNLLDIVVSVLGLLYYIVPSINKYILNAFKILRIVLIIKLFRFSRNLRILAYIVKACKKELFILLIYVSLSTIIFSSFVYLVEGFSDDNSEFTSIPFTFW